MPSAAAAEPIIEAIVKRIADLDPLLSTPVFTDVPAVLMLVVTGAEELLGAVTVTLVFPVLVGLTELDDPEFTGITVERDDVVSLSTSSSSAKSSLELLALRCTTVLPDSVPLDRVNCAVSERSSYPEGIPPVTLKEYEPELRLSSTI